MRRGALLASALAGILVGDAAAETFRIIVHRVPSRYTSTRSKSSGEITDTRPVRWPSFGSGLQFHHSGTVAGANNGGVDALQAALAAWTNDLDSNVVLQHGGPTAAGRIEDGVNTVIFNDPEGRIAGSYVQDRFEATTNNLSAPRRQHTATVIDANQVLIAGGAGNPSLNTAEVYTVATGTFLPTLGSMASPRTNHAAALVVGPLVLIAGGSNGSSVLRSAEQYDPLSRTFSPAGNDMNSPRAEFVAVPFDQGQKVLLAGGTNGSAALATGEVYDANASSFTAMTSTMSSARRAPAAAITSTKILIAGGSNGNSDLATADVFDTVTMMFSSTGAMSTPRFNATATTLSDTQDRILIVGGTSGGAVLDSAELYDPSTGAFTPARGRLSSARVGHRGRLLPNGMVLISGGTDGTTTLTSAELFDPDSETFLPLSFPMSSARSEHTSTLLSNGDVLLAGGGTNTSERYISAASRILAEVTLYSNFQEHIFAVESFWNITEADIVIQDDLSGPGLNNGGLAQLLAHAIGLALGFADSSEPAVLNQTFDFENPPYGPNLRPYDQEALAVVYPVCPTITTQPQSLTIPPGETATLTVGVSGGDLTYQWYEGATPVGTNAPSFTTPPLSSTTSYIVRISNNCGSVDSAMATVTVSSGAAQKGDVNGDSAVNAADVIYLLRFLFASGTPPVGSADVNASGTVNVADVFYFINYLFSNGPAPM